ncbi:MAG: ComEC/Rec2 family competence protein [bacterium]|nr:ComEC/Rec2 family competence protein [bacterium]
MLPRREVSFSDVPAIGFAVSAFLGAAASLVLSIRPGIALSVVIAGFISALAALLLFRQRQFGIFFVYVTILLIALMRGNANIAREERELMVRFDPDTAIVSCRGVVVWRDEARQTNLSDRLWLDGVRLSSPDTAFECDQLRVRLSIPVADAVKVRIGNVVACNVRLESAHKIQERSVHELCWTLRERIVAEARLKDTESLVIVPGTWTLNEVVYEARHRVLALFEHYLRPDARAVAGALLLGSREAFSSQFREDLQLTGLAHLFALSGLNTGLLVSLLWLLLAWMRVPGRTRYALLLLLLIGYTVMGLGVPSLFRSAMMAGLVIIARLLARPSHPVNLLLFAAGGELLIWPLHILDAGFLLSYLSMAGILTAYLALRQPLQDLLKSGTQTLRRRTADTMSSTIGAQLATAPTAALLFGRVPGLAIILNVIAIPLFSLLVVLILWMMLLDPINEVAASVVARAIEGFVGLFAYLTSGSAALIGASIITKTPLWASSAAIIAQIFAIVISLRGRTQIALITTLVAMNLLIWPSLLADPCSARVMVLGDTESPVVYARAGAMSAVVSCGSEWNSNRTADKLRTAMSSDGQSRIDILVIDSRAVEHIGGAPLIIDAIKPEIALDFSSPRDTRASELLDAAITIAHAENVHGILGFTWDEGSGRFQIESCDISENDIEWSIRLSDDSLMIRILNKDDFVSETPQITLVGKVLTVSCFPNAKSESFVFADGKWEVVGERTRVLMELMRLPRNDKS